MTNSWTDIGNATLVVVMGANPSENHPACMAHINRARAAAPKTLPGGQTSNKPAAELWVIDPRKTRTACQADRFIRIRPGTDIAFINAVTNYIQTALDADRTGGWTDQRLVNLNAFLNQTGNQAWRADDGTNTGTISRSKYTDARLIVNSGGTDYDRALHETSTGSVITAFPRVASTYYGDAQTVYNRLKAHTTHYSPAIAAAICGCDAQDIIDVAEKMMDHSRISSYNTATSVLGTADTIIGDPTSQYYRSTTMLYAMGLTQHTYGSQNVKSFAVIQTLLGNVGRAGGGINALRGIHNVQGSTDMGVLYGNIPAYSGNPSTQPYEDTHAFGKYIDALWGIRISRAKRAYLALASGAGETVKYAAKTAGVAGNSYFVRYLDPGVAGALSVAVLANTPAAGQTTVQVTLAHDGVAPTSTANDVVAAIKASAGAAALIDCIVSAGGATVVAAAGPTALAGGVDADYNPAYPGSGLAGAGTGLPTLSGMALQQYGFYSMTRKWFGDTTYVSKADVDKIYSLWPKVNGTNHIQMFRNMISHGTGQSDTLTFSGTPGTITLTKKGIKAGTIAIAGYTEGTDFKVSYPTGVITRIATGTIPAGATVTVTYDYGITAAMVWGQNPAITEPNQAKVREGLYQLDTLVVTDMFATETAQCDRKPGGVTYLIPACAHVEKAGSVTNSGRTLQWRTAARPPRGNSRSDMFWLFKMAQALDAASAFTHITGVWATLSTPKAGSVYTNMYVNQYAFTEANWDPAVPATAVAANELVAENVFKEMATGSTAGGTIWIYTDGYKAALTDERPADYGAWTLANRAKSRETTDLWGTLAFPRWGYSWLVNRRVLYNNGDVIRAVAPTYPSWAASTAYALNTKIVAASKIYRCTTAGTSGAVAPTWPASGTVNDGTVVWTFFASATAAEEPDAYQGPDKCARLFVSTNSGLIDYADSNYRTIHRLSDVPKTPAGANPAVHVLPGRFPAHTEPYESPHDGTIAGKADYATTYGYNSTGTAGNLLLSGTPRGTGATYPYVLTTIRCVEHFQGGPITRNNPANHEAEPEPWIEINSVDARTEGISTGDWVKVITARTDGYANDQLDDDPHFPDAAYGQGFRARVGVGVESNQRVAQGVVAIPWHWGERGLSKGSRANDITIDAMDANTTIPEFKACLCRIVRIP
ncbi:MAG: hypothetical protein FDZ70_01365 [Actinobacteria bacterium]|nr:MAG: hypothetical protein FDZ70_01365 [Actinomycetota bacterium]